MPNMGTSTANTAPPLNIQVNGVKKLLLGQNPHTASDPDQAILAPVLASLGDIFPERLELSVARLNEQPDVSGFIPGPATFFRRN